MGLSCIALCAGPTYRGAAGGGGKVGSPFWLDVGKGTRLQEYRVSAREFDVFWKTGRQDERRPETLPWENPSHKVRGPFGIKDQTFVESGSQKIKR